MSLASSFLRFLALLLLLITPVSESSAHDHSLATWEIAPGPGQSMSLRVSFVQAAAHEALFAKHGRESIMGISRAQYEDLVVAYIQEHTTIKVGEAPLLLEESERQIDSHASLVDFKLKSQNFQADGLEVELLAFTESPRQRQVLRVLGADGGVVSERLLLRDNEYRAQLSELWGESLEDDSVDLSRRQILLGGLWGLLSLVVLWVLWVEARPQKPRTE